MSESEAYAVVSCHVERVTDDRVWSATSRLLDTRCGGFAVTPFLRPPAEGENEAVWLERARFAASRGPVGHHTHWGGPTRARPVHGVDAGPVARAEAEWLRGHAIEPRFFCGGGWYLDTELAETIASLHYVDCTATTFRQTYLTDSDARVQVDGLTRLALPSGATLLELPATHSLGMLARGLFTLHGFVHVYFHDWELLDPKRAAAMQVLLRLLGRRREPLTIAELVERSADAPEVSWPDTIAA